MTRPPGAGPAGARTISTTQVQLARHVVNDIAVHQAVGVIYGMAGLGKTFAVRTTVAALPPVGKRKVPVCAISFPSRPTMRLVADLLLQELSGHQPSRNNNRFTLTGALVKELARQPRLLVVDEAQRLSEECIDLLRYLHDHDETRFGLLYVGGNGCWEVLKSQPMLRSRIWRRQEFTALPPDEVPTVMRGYHPMYADADDDLLSYVDERFAHGIWRNWALFSSTAALLAQRTGRTRIDMEIVNNTFALHGGDDG
ncbi:ATP-binding protein [Micromonospora sp. ATCC 39149]|uniref:ATP-binding protein n=1 Tax=Micromonospora sp. (strain ATCC 39149 / NRRL 15099 / SCC 1413) TaxID=219305 RepID=UPI0002DDFD98|nr:ATP-binding protein [Micromonospora sp. ATCC 39149]